MTTRLTFILGAAAVYVGYRPRRATRGLCLHRPKKYNSKKFWSTSLMFKNY